MFAGLLVIQVRAQYYDDYYGGIDKNAGGGDYSYPYDFDNQPQVGSQKKENVRV